MKTSSKSKNLRSLSLSIVAVALLALVLSSCSKKNDENENMSAYVKVTNAAEGSAAQDFYLDDAKLTASAVTYGSSSDFVAASTGNHQGKFEDSGTATVNASFSLSLQAGKYYSVFYADGKSYGSFADDRTTPQSGKIRIRFINLCSALGTAADFGITTGSKVASNLAYKAASAYYDVDPSVALSLYATGSSNALLSIPGTFEAGHIYTIYISGTTTASITAHVIAEN
ncbi:MAG TPA: DUF4397 domain-containing protein [Mucilaginibacter sp.]|nr:DUF4397 domain-containing protein [Mucilaginibacter sp.]